jgi:hypothetical protein
MGNRYGYQEEVNFKPAMRTIEGFVSVGTGGLLNYPDAYPVFPIATGATGVAGQTGVPRFTLPNAQATAGVPTGWQGGYSGSYGLFGAGVAGIQRVATGLYCIGLQDDWVALDSCQAQPVLGATGCTGLDSAVLAHTVGWGNTVATGGFTLPQFGVMNPKNQIWIQFNSGAGLPADVPGGGGFFLTLMLRDTLVGVR